MAAKLRTWDAIQVIAGKYKGSLSKITSRDGDMVFCEWLNIMKKAVKKQWYKDVQKPLHVSNVMYHDGQIASKVAFIIQSGKKIRIAVKTKNPL